jgi:predicted CXXCH cytochrome family protein
LFMSNPNGHESGMERASGRWGVIAIVVIAALLLFPATALAYDEPHNQPRFTSSGGVNHGTTGQSCNSCHRAAIAGGSYDCTVCHPFSGAGPEVRKGPHGAYSASSDRCDACHTVHAAGSTLLLSKPTVTDACYACHDGTGGQGVYGAIAARGGTVAGTHRIDTTNTVPGGDAVTGGSATMAFGGPGGTLGCDDCHSPHDSSTVASFTLERRRTDEDSYLDSYKLKTNRLLRQNPGGSTATATVYGSDWCLACHKGRSSAGPAHNHPVDSKAATSNPFYYESAAILTTDAPTSTTTTGTLARTNRGYLMPYPRSSQQAGHSPICQQCHEDSRNVGQLVGAGITADAATFSITATDGKVPGDNPRFQNFPHETANARMLVENGDDLCTNCHPPAALP